MRPLLPLNLSRNALLLIALAGCQATPDATGLAPLAASEGAQAPSNLSLDLQAKEHLPAATATGAAASEASAESPVNGSAAAASLRNAPAPTAAASPRPSAGASATPWPLAKAPPLPSGASAASIFTRFGNQSVPRIGTGPLMRGYQIIQDLGMNTLREGWNWKYIETGHEQYVSWMSWYDQMAASFIQLGLQPMAMVTDTPDWASSDPQYAKNTTWNADSPGKYTVPAGLHAAIFADGTDTYKPGAVINPNNYYAQYMVDMVSRFKGRIHTWQVWNEPDYPSGDTAAGTLDASGNQRFWDGSVRDYVRLLQISTVLVKGIDPAAKIALGGLGYSSYLGAIIDAGGAPYFDTVDFHAYGTDKTSSNGVLDSDWGFLGRYKAMKAVLAQKGVRGKAFSCSETGFTADNPQEQAAYVSKLFAAAEAQGDIEAVDWAVFTNPGFLNIGLIDGATLSKPTLGYGAFKVATGQLTGAVPVGALSAPGVQGYRFKRADGKALTVAWASGSSAGLALSAMPSQILDKFGHDAAGSLKGSQLSLTSDPLYLVGP